MGLIRKVDYNLVPVHNGDDCKNFLADSIEAVFTITCNCGLYSADEDGIRYNG